MHDEEDHTVGHEPWWNFLLVMSLGVSLGVKRGIHFLDYASYVFSLKLQRECMAEPRTVEALYVLVMFLCWRAFPLITVVETRAGIFVFFMAWVCGLPSETLALLFQYVAAYVQCLFCSRLRVKCNWSDLDFWAACVFVSFQIKSPPCRVLTGLWSMLSADRWRQDEPGYRRLTRHSSLIQSSAFTFPVLCVLWIPRFCCQK